MSERIFYRLATGQKNQDFYTALCQVASNEIWGGLSMYGNGFLQVRAFRGELPDGEDGVEFSTSIPPTRGCEIPGVRGEVYWKLHEQSPGVLASDDGDFARISATIRKVRYTKDVHLKPRCEWSPP